MSSFAFRSVMSLRLFPIPVSASVCASTRLAASRSIFSRNVNAIRAMTKTIELAARAIAIALSDLNWP